MRAAQAGIRIAVAVAAVSLAAHAASLRPAIADDPLIELVPVTTSISSPVAVTHAGDGSGRLFITEQQGRIVIFDGVTLLPDAFLDITALTSCCGERGLLSVAFHPDYASNGYFYVNYTDNGGDTVVARYTVSGDPDVADAGSALPILSIDQPQANHNGGQLQFGPDGYLYIAMGDGGGGGDPSNFAQNPATLLGKLLRIDVDGAPPYEIPADNPFVSDPVTLDEIWATGLRNPWRFSFDRLNGDLYLGDVGQSALEEVDFQPAASPGGENYGWRLMEGASCFIPSSGCNDGSLTLPVVEYAHTDDNCSISGGYVYRGSQYADLYGRYFFADYCTGRIWSAPTGGPAPWPFVEMLDSQYNVTSFGEDEDGELYVVHHGGTVYRIESTMIDGDGDGVGDAVDNCPSVPNPLQQNTDAAIGSGPDVPGDDATIPTSQPDPDGDHCEDDGDIDNDGIPDGSEAPLAGCGVFDGTPPAHPNPGGGDITSADGNGPAWDTDDDQVRDSVECFYGTNPRQGSPGDLMACSASAYLDTDGDGLSDKVEVCKWGSDPGLPDSDGDGSGDCLEAYDVNGNGLTSAADGTLVIQASFGIITGDWAFDVNGNGLLSVADGVLVRRAAGGVMPCA
jgi:glucose/arabinose dehydrogenase